MWELALIGFMVTIFVLVLVGTVGFVAPSLPTVFQRVLQPSASPTLQSNYPGQRDRISWVEILFGLAIYVSSTADLLRNGFENSPWLPLGLGALAMTGILAGVIWRIRGVSLLSSVFFLVSITTMIWYGTI